MVYHENNVRISYDSNYLTPKHSETYFNPEMILNREIIYGILKSQVTTSRVLQCLDAFSATGITSIQWKVNLSDRVNIFSCDIKKTCIDAIKSNATENGLKSNCITYDSLNKEYDPNELSNGLNIFEGDSNVLMLIKSFDFIHLDPFGSTSFYLDACFKNIKNNGLVVLTSTDVATLLARNPETCTRNYGSVVIKTLYNRELAVRTVIAAAVKASAKCNKGVSVLLSVVQSNFIVVVIKIVRGCKEADKSLKLVKELIHCRLCEERCWYPDQLAPVEDPYNTLLKCKCHEENPGKTGVKLGPFWSGEIYDEALVEKLVKDDEFSLRTKEYQKIIQSIRDEIINCKICNSVDSKRRKVEIPPFYYFPHTINIGSITPKMDDLVKALQNKGHLACRTHMEYKAIRTSARKNELAALLRQLIS